MDFEEYMNYEEQLNSVEWKKQRLDILKRDNNSCLICANKNIIGNTTPCHFYQKSNESYINGDVIYVIQPVIEYIGAILIDKEIFRSLDLNNCIFYCDLKTGNLNLLAIATTQENGAISWWVKGLLHVHHTYYQIGKRAWEYPNECLQTLCWKCHENTHKNSTIKVRDENGVDIGEMRYCYRCYGAGRFPEYSHVQNGICFRCNGARYEELIKT